MIVNWKKPNAGLKYMVAQSSENASAGHIVLRPGDNDVPDALWNAAKHNLKNDPEKEWIEEVSKQEVVDKLPKDFPERAATKKEGKFVIDSPVSIKDMKPEDAVAMIKETINTETLEGWLKSAEKDEIRVEIKNQLDFIKNPKKEK